MQLKTSYKKKWDHGKWKRYKIKYKVTCTKKICIWSCERLNGNEHWKKMHAHICVCVCVFWWKWKYINKNFDSRTNEWCACIARMCRNGDTYKFEWNLVMMMMMMYIALWCLIICTKETKRKDKKKISKTTQCSANPRWYHQFRFYSYFFWIQIKTIIMSPHRSHA